MTTNESFVPLARPKFQYFTYVLAGTQLLVFAGLIALAWGFYNTPRSVHGGEAPDRPLIGMLGGERRSDGGNLGSPRNASNEGPHQAALMSLTGRIEHLEGRLSEVAALVAKASVQLDSRKSTVHPQTLEASGELIEKGDLRSRFSQQTRTSEWGDQAAKAIDDGYLNTFANKPFFAEYGGQVLTDCRESVCSMNWAPEPTYAATLSPEERGVLLALAKWPMLALAGRANAGGEVEVSMDLDSEPPSIEVLIEHESRALGGDNAQRNLVFDPSGIAKRGSSAP